MTTAVATVGLFYDSVDVQLADLSIFFEIRRGLNEPPTVRGTDSIVPALAGSVEGLRINHVLPIELVGFVRSTAGITDPDDQRASFRTNQQVVRALFRPNRERAILTAVLEDRTIQTIDARPMYAIWNERIPGFVAEASITLEGYDDWVVVEGS